MKQINNTNNNHPLKKMSWGVISINNYRGVLVTKMIGGYSVLGQKVQTEEQVDEVIDAAAEKLNNSIKRNGA